jgi:uncharacterized protein (TIGR00288 family)
MGGNKNVAVFIDADNLNDPTALDHVMTEARTMGDRILYRRAYGRPDSLKAVEAVLWKHGVRPVANMIVDKVTTDGALVIDAVEAVCSNAIDVVAICSGDADFVPLATWLREKGCRVICFSLPNKIFANPESFYDDVVLLNVVDPDATHHVRQSVESGAAIQSNATPLQKPAARPAPKKTPRTNSTQAPPDGTAKVSVKAILKAVPELKEGQALHLSMVSKKLRDAGLLGKNASSPPLLRRFTAQFELTPQIQPNQVRYRG